VYIDKGEIMRKMKSTITDNSVQAFLACLEKEANIAYTENGARAYGTTGNANLDLFGSVASLRHADYAQFGSVFSNFERAYNEDAVLATRMLFWLRDVRGGAGERGTFRKFLCYLANGRHPYIVSANLANIAEYGRYDDLWILLDTPLRNEVLQFVDNQWAEDYTILLGKTNAPISLLSKWLPSENASNKDTIRYAKMIRKALGLTSKDYRKALTKMRNYLNVVEVKMSANEWNNIDFSKLPSKAGMRYSAAFQKHAYARYLQFLEDVALGKVNINASTLFPYEIVRKVRESGTCFNTNVDIKTLADSKVLDLLWKNLPDYLEGTPENILCMVDTSGSMHGGMSSIQNSIAPIDVALSLGIYTAERNTGAFKDKFITFSAEPTLQTLVGKTIQEKVRNLNNANWDMNTNIERAFDVILEAAVKSKTKPAEMISKLIIISDMEFDAANADGSGYKRGTKRGTVFMDSMRVKYADHGYELPSLVYWNVDDRNGVKHATVADTDFCMVSGASPSIFKGIFNGEIEIVSVDVFGNETTKTVLDPVEVMKATLMSERYDKVVVA
jgi:hypothetical protein